MAGLSLSSPWQLNHHGPPSASAVTEDPDLSLPEEAKWPSRLKGLIFAPLVPFTLPAGNGLNENGRGLGGSSGYRWDKHDLGPKKMIV